MYIRYLAVLILAIFGSFLFTAQRSVAQSCGSKFSSGKVLPGQSAQIQGEMLSSMRSTFATRKPKEIVLHNSHGGHVRLATWMARSGIPVRITGTHCDSACVMVLVNSPKACLEKSVELIRFHSIVTRYCFLGMWSRTVVQEHDTRIFTNKLREPLRTRLLHLAKKKCCIQFQPKSS